jgi:hypothetical protein
MTEAYPTFCSFEYVIQKDATFICCACYSVVTVACVYALSSNDIHSRTTSSSKDILDDDSHHEGYRQGETVTITNQEKDELKAKQELFSRQK